VNPAAKRKIFQHTYSSLEEHEKVSPARLLGNRLCITCKSKFLTFKVHWILHIQILIHAKCDQFESFIAPTNAQHIYIKTLNFLH